MLHDGRPLVLRCHKEPAHVSSPARIRCCRQHSNQSRLDVFRNPITMNSKARIRCSRTFRSVGGDTEHEFLECLGGVGFDVYFGECSDCGTRYQHPGRPPKSRSATPIRHGSTALQYRHFVLTFRRVLQGDTEVPRREHREQQFPRGHCARVQDALRICVP